MMIWDGNLKHHAEDRSNNVAGPSHSDTVSTMPILPPSPPEFDKLTTDQQIDSVQPLGARPILN